MPQDTVLFNVGGTKFEINRYLVQAYPKSRLAELINSGSGGIEIFIDHNPLAFSVILDFLRYKRLVVPRNVAREVVELQLQEFGIPYDNLTEGVRESDELPSYEATVNKFPGPYRDEKRVHNSLLKDTVLEVSIRKMDTLVTDVILPFLKRHAKRAHREVTFYLTPNIVTPQNITSELEHQSDPHEWIYLPSSEESLKFKSSVDVDSESDDLPDIKFLLQRDTLERLEDFIVTKSSVKRVEARKLEVNFRTENEFGLLFTKTMGIVEIHVIII
ncbi:34_t:CDS:2 [Acaulospora colombiana]|uniref:34_t:CDS:1 n=1 Tax=Acaulospora colombiana TaxID=27376 RepID=A0ACA9KE73_9GLOM|nr:34_t:CDS:2 [Acaulospora colombiana]